MRQRSLRIQLLSIHPSRRADFLRPREWFIGTGLDLLPSSRSRRPQYHRRRRLLRRIHGRLHHDGDEDSLSTCRGIFDGFDYAPILDNLQAIASNRRIEYGGDEEFYTIDSCFGFTPSVQQSTIIRIHSFVNPTITEPDLKWKFKKNCSECTRAHRRCVFPSIGNSECMRCTKMHLKCYFIYSGMSNSNDNLFIMLPFLLFSNVVIVISCRTRSSK